MRLHDHHVLSAVVGIVGPHLDKGFDAEDWLSDPDNIALTDGYNFVLFEDRAKVFNCHWLMQDRGRKAIDAARKLLAAGFEEYGALAIKGTTPLAFRHAAWFNRQLGGISHGMIDTVFGPQELFILMRP